jgi:NitT/TauT family transport system substrate-binding protein
MKKIMILVILGLAAIISNQSQAKEKISYAHLIDPSLEGLLYAIKSNIVKSNSIIVDAKALAIPALIQSTPTKRFDVIMNAVMAIPLAKKRGLDLVVLSTALRAGAAREGGSVWVKASSPYKTMKDLKGKTIGNYALRATGTTWIRIALWKAHGMNVSYKGGDMNWVQLPAPTLLGALETGRIDAATLIHSQAYAASKSGKYRTIAETSKDIYKLFGIDTVSAVNVSYPEKLKARPAAFKEFNRMLKASVDYAVANPMKVGKAISKTNKISPDFFKAWLTRFSFFPAVVSSKDVKAMETVWQNAKEMGIIKKFPSGESVVWKHAIRE